MRAFPALEACVVLLSAALLAVEPATGADPGPAAGPVRAPSVARGRELYMTVGCRHCHGTEGQGSNSGTRIAPDPLPAEAMATFIRATHTAMPAYDARVLGDADVADIAAYLRTIKPAKPADEIPALRLLKPAP